jgi:anaerobic magnesium-protoporphyrin IX monomethyl ester cyclase
MLSVLDLLIHHSYLAGQMKAAMKEGGAGMPQEVKDLIRSVKGHGAGAAHPVAPIP